MSRRRLLFVAIVGGAVLNAGVTLTAFGSELRSIDAVDGVKAQIDTTVEGIAVTERRMTVTLRVGNPTRIGFRVISARARLHNGTSDRIAAGAATGLEATTVPPRGSVSTVLRIRIASDRVGPAQTAIERGATVTLRVGMKHREIQFAITRSQPVNGSLMGGN